MLKKFGYGLAVMGALMFGVGAVNTSIVSPVLASEDDEEKDESGELMSSTVKIAFGGSITPKNDKGDEDEDEGESGKLVSSHDKGDEDEDEGESGKLISSHDKGDEDEDESGKLMSDKVKVAFGSVMPKNDEDDEDEDEDEELI